MNALRRTTLAALIALVIVIALGLLSGCGGGDGDEAEPDDRATVGPVDCRARPELCI